MYVLNNTCLFIVAGIFSAMNVVENECDFMEKVYANSSGIGEIK
jgi:hypothetical protein